MFPLAFSLKARHWPCHLFFGFRDMNIKSFSSGDLLADRRADYARVLDEAGEFEAAADLMEQALERVPDWPAGLAMLAAFREHAGQFSAAVETLKALDDKDDSDLFAAPLKLAVLGAADAPAHPPGRYVEALFDSYAEHFDEALTERLAYTAPQQLAALLNEVEGQERRFRLCVDVGCGTGLSGEVLASRVDRLEGFDLSLNMLSKAAEKGLYQDLRQADLLQCPEKSGLFGEPFAQGRADLVIAADVLMYIGALENLMMNVRQLTASAGMFLFSVEDAGEGDHFRLLPSLRYAHSRRYVEKQLSACGFQIKAFRNVTLRKDGGADVPGIIFLAEHIFV